MSRKKSGRVFAEWITLTVSAATILALMVYLVFETVRAASPYVSLVARPVPEESAQVGDRFVLPVDFENRGNRSASYAKFRVTVSGRMRREIEAEVEYLGRRSKQRIYFYLEQDPRSAEIEVVPLYYRVD